MVRSGPTRGRGNRPASRTDYPHMRCQHCREALSARLDGEDPGVPDGVVDAHVAGCPDCRAFAEGVAVLRRRLTVRPAEPVPDLRASILAAAASSGAVARTGSDATPGATPAAAIGGHWSRWALLAVALTQLVLAVPPMLLGHDAGASVHVAREIGAWDVALASALLLVVARPGRAGGLVPFAGALAVAMVAAALVDLVTGRADVLAESQHVLDLVGLALLWVLARQPVDDTPLVEGLRRPRHPLAA